MTFPHPKRKNTWKGHRSVVIPDYQGVRIGRNFTNYIAEMFMREGKSFISTTSNPSMIFARKTDEKWVLTRIGRAGVGSATGFQNKYKKGSTSHNRITVSFEYVGNKSNT